MTPKSSKKAQNIYRKSKFYFSIDDENFPYKGVKGKGEATILEDKKKIMLLVKKINMKYLVTLDHPIAKMLLDNTQNGIEGVFEITLKFFSSWNFGKA